MALKAGYYGLKKKLLTKVNSLPAIKSIGDGLSLNASTGELTATGGSDTSDCYKTTDDTESAIVDADYIPFLDSSAASGEGASKKSTWSNFCSKIAAKFATVFNEYLGISSIGSGLTVDEDGVLVATGSGSGSWPAISEMTTPTIYSNRVKNVVGGYKQVGKIVYVDVACVVNESMTYTALLPEISYYGVLNEFPAPLKDLNPLYISAFGGTNIRPHAVWADIEGTGSHALCIGMAQTDASTGTAIPVNTTINIRGTYEALTSI